MFNYLAQLSDVVEVNQDNFEAHVGLHLLSNYASEYAYLGANLSDAAIRHALYQLDWYRHFYQLIVVIQPGISMEVGGSLDPSDGLSACYRNRHTQSEGVIRCPPESVQDLEQILVAFAAGDEWQSKYHFDFTEDEQW